ncbi:MAG: Serine/threonine protein kinase PrkC, regulator of stationary phase [Firmicutes bacterium]|nr:Serine/threonine protein kinase PrkC, regulator of stationary phase [Bacillota bacterium]MDI6705479.1 Stk1 family PASTA domain-containing Ser/Thr kinase [Bacillota bacterium]
MIGKVLGNRYEIVEKIGSGGMSHVYKAKCGLLNRYVAVKVLRPEFTSDEDFVRKFRRESQAAASLSHQNIVSIYDVGVDGDIHYIVMEYIEGRTLKELIRERKRLSPVQAAEIAQQICKALLHAHKNHIIHRDIKPHNILMTKDGIAKVTDFGIARAVTGSTVTNTGSVIGSVHYFSPEQARGGYIDEKSDLYSLGIVMYEMVTGKVPFEGESPISIALKHLQEQVTPPGKIIDDFPKGLEQIIMKAIEKEAAKRYNTAEELLLDLKSFCKDKDVVFDFFSEDKGESPTIVMPAVREGTVNDGKKKEKGSDPAGKGKKRKKKSIIVLAVVLLALLGLGFGASYFLSDLLSVKVVKVPDIVGKTEEEARSALKEWGLKMEIRERQNNPNFEAGTVISQYPKEGTENKVTNPVLVVLSLGPEKTEVPYLINFSSAEAELKLQLAGLEVGEVTPKYSETVTVGVVMDQNPQPGIMVDQGTTVDLVVSAGPELEQISVPPVVGLDLQTAKTRVQNAGMILADIFYQESDVPEGYVLSQSVAPNTLVEEGASIVLGVSSGKKKVEPVVEGTYILTVTLPQGEKNVKVTVKKYQDGVEETEYQRRHDADEGPLKIEIKGKGKVRVVVLFNDVTYRDEIIDFSKEE